MSYRNNKGKNNVTYLNKKKTNRSYSSRKTTANKVGNKRSTTKKSKYSSNKRSNKGKVNIKKLSVLALGIVLLGFGTLKATSGVSNIVKSISTKIIKTSDAEVKPVQKQFDLSTENDGVMSKFNVYIDPGRGGEDNGMESEETGKYEKEITLGIGKKLASKLSNYDDVNVIMSRTDDSKTMSFKERAEDAKKQKADLIISLQLNAHSGDAPATGIETYYKEDELYHTGDIARVIQDSITSYVEVKDRGVGIGKFGILNEATIPAIIIKCGFITNPEDVKKLTDENYLNEFTEGIAQGLLSYIDSNK